MTTPEGEHDSWVELASAYLTQRRIRAHAIILAVCLWGVCAVDYATPGIFDRAGTIKFQDFIQFPIAASLIAQGRASELYNDRVLADGIRAIVGRDTTVQLQYFYGPQVALPFIPLGRFSFLVQAGIWTTLSLLMYFACVDLLWKACPSLRPYRALVALCAIAYPPLFHFFVRGQVSAVVLVCFTAACLAFLAGREWLAGIALGLLVFKPQFLVAVPLVLLLAQAWKVFAGLVLSASAQLAFAVLYFGPPVMRPYVSMLLHSAGQPSTTELRFLSDPDALPAHVLGTLDPLAARRWNPLRPEFDCRGRNGSGHLEVVCSAPPSFFRSHPSQRARQPSHLRLRSSGVGSRIPAASGLGSRPREALFPGCTQRLAIPRIRAASAWALVALDSPSTVCPSVHRIVMSGVADIQNSESQICVERIRRCITLLPTGNPMRTHKTILIVLMVLSCALATMAQSKPKLTLDEFFNSVSFPSVEISPDGNSVVIVTDRADWDQQIFRTDLWLYHDDGKGGNLIQLTQSGHDSDPKWSPDGRWIAFLSERKSASEKGGDSDSDADSKGEAASQIYLISPNGGEAFPVTQGEEDVHSFSWSADSQTIYFSTRQPWTKAQKDAYKNDWKDVVQYRTAERGDAIFALDLSVALAHHAAAPTKAVKKEGRTRGAARSHARSPRHRISAVASR